MAVSELNVIDCGYFLFSIVRVNPVPFFSIELLTTGLPEAMNSSFANLTMEILQINNRGHSVSNKLFSVALREHRLGL